jgi:hypothetical protein
MFDLNLPIVAFFNVAFLNTGLGISAAGFHHQAIERWLISLTSKGSPGSIAITQTDINPLTLLELHPTRRRGNGSGRFG